MELPVDLKLDNTSFFSIVKDPSSYSNELNSDLKTNNKWKFQWKMSFNFDPLKQAPKARFSKKSNVRDHPDIVFNNNIVHKVLSQKHVELIPDDKRNFKENIDKNSAKLRKE